MLKRFRHFLAWALAAALAIALTACQSPKSVNYSAYEKIPASGASVILRPLLKLCPYTKQRAFYGNWGGSGNAGGKPIDALDDVFRRHDILYTFCEANSSQVIADQAMLDALKKLDETKLTAEAKSFSQRAAGYFTSGMSKYVGKPLGGFFKKKERPENPFADPANIHKFFDPSHPGFPHEFAQEHAAAPSTAKKPSR